MKQDINNTPLVSVIVLTYNQQNTVAQAIDSVLAQQCGFPYEIILADDGSGDQTPSVCREYAARFPDRIRLMLSERNRGLVENYFEAVLHARGKYIADCAGDDFWTATDRLRRQVDILEKEPDISIVHADWNYYDSATGAITSPVPASGVFRYRQARMDGRQLLKAYMAAEEVPVPLIHLSTALYRKSIFDDEYGRNKDLFRNPAYRCEDVSVISTMLANGNVAFIRDKVLNYRVGHSSISSGEDPAKTFDFYFSSLLMKLRLMDIYGVEEVKDSEAFRRNVHFLLSQAFLSRSKERMVLITDTIKRHRLHYSLKGRVYSLIWKNDLLWRMGVNLMKSKRPS